MIHFAPDTPLTLATATLLYSLLLKLHGKTLQWLDMGSTLVHHPLSGLVASAGELLRTP